MSAQGSSLTISSRIVRAGEPRPEPLQGELRELAVSTLTQLARLVSRRASTGKLLEASIRGRLERLADIAFEVVIETGSPIARAMTDLLAERWLPVLADQLMNLCGEKRFRDSYPLMDLAVEATRQVFKFRRIWDADRRSLTLFTGTDPSLPPIDSAMLRKASLALAAHNLAARLFQSGQRFSLAQETIEMALELRRELADARPDRYGRYLADSLLNNSRFLAATRHATKALESAQEATAIYRGLAKTAVVSYRQRLAECLIQLSSCLSLLNRSQSSCGMALEALEICREISRGDENARFSHAKALLRLSRAHLPLRQYERAHGAAYQAVRLLHGLAQDRPDAFSDSLASALDHLGSVLVRLDRRQKALEVTAKAVSIYRELDVQYPGVFRSELVLVLNNLSLRLHALGRPEEALAIIDEAVEICRDLADERFGLHSGRLAMSLSNRSAMLKSLQRLSDARSDAEEAVRIRRRQVAAEPDAFAPDLAMSLNNLSAALEAMSLRDEALGALEEAVALFRRAAAQEPEAFLPKLAISLRNLSYHLLISDRPEEALFRAEESVRYMLKVFRQHPQAVARRTRIITDHYLGVCRATGKTPSRQILRSVADVIQSGSWVDTDARIDVKNARASSPPPSPRS